MHTYHQAANRRDRSELRLRQLLPLLLLNCVVLHGREALADQGPPSDEGSEQLQPIVVTGSLIPQVTAETASPVTVISAEDIQARGFTTVADALQQSSFATGSVVGPQSNVGSPTPALQTLSMFGISPSYVKYLIDGRPMSDYPALYNVSDMVANLAGLPTQFVDHVDILPGGQSSLYGSDAIAGVVNVILKKKLDGPVVDVRYGFYKDGGGVDKRLDLADSFHVGTFNVLAGAQYEKTTPIWGYQRSLTSSYYGAGTSPATAERDYLIYGSYLNPNGIFYFMDPKNCANVSREFGNSVALYSRPGLGSYCGTKSSGYYTLNNGTESVQGYLHATDDLSPYLQLFGDVLLDHEVTRFNGGAGFYGNYYYDPNLGDLVGLQHIFSPEEAGGLDEVTSKAFQNAFRATLGAQGSLWTSGWTYDLDVTHTEERLVKHLFLQKTVGLENFFSSILGPQMGVDPIYGFLPIFTPHYAAFYAPATPAEYKSFSGYGSSHSDTSDTMLRTQLTDSALFPLPGDPAALAIAIEGGNQGWRFIPDPGYLNGDYYGYRATTGSGHRSRYATTGELRLPVLKMLTINASGRYDLYRVSGNNVDKATYNLGLEFRPFAHLLLRGRYGTAFKTPSLADEFQGKSGFSESATDYYQCALGGYTGANIGNCPYYQSSYFGTTSGNPKLKPIAANVWDTGIVWSPLESISISADYLHFAIGNETAIQSADELLKTESFCRLGIYAINSPTCVAALSQVARDPSGQISSISTPKVNVSQEALNTLTAAIKTKMDVGRAGTIAVQASYTDMVKHIFQQYPGDPIIDYLRDPTQSTDFKTKANGSLTWNKAQWSGTVYVAWYGRTPNYLASNSGYGTPGAAALSPWTLYNVTSHYQVTPGLGVSLALDNLLNTMPPADHSYPGTSNSPYNSFNYNAYGRSYYIEVNYKFGT